MIDRLTKENFWNALYEKYPGEVQVFCDWIDKYKSNVDWNDLFFNKGIVGRTPHPLIIRYHDIPLAMQWGIFQQFCAEQHPSGFGGIESTFEHPSDMDKIPELITEYFAEMKGNNDQERSSLKYS